MPIAWKRGALMWLSQAAKCSAALPHCWASACNGTQVETGTTESAVSGAGSSKDANPRASGWPGTGRMLMSNPRCVVHCSCWVIVPPPFALDGLALHDAGGIIGTHQAILVVPGQVSDALPLAITVRIEASGVLVGVIGVVHGNDGNDCVLLAVRHIGRLVGMGRHVYSPL